MAIFFRCLASFIVADFERGVCRRRRHHPSVRQRAVYLFIRGYGSRSFSPGAEEGRGVSEKTSRASSATCSPPQRVIETSAVTLRHNVESPGSPRSRSVVTPAGKEIRGRDPGARLVPRQTLWSVRHRVGLKQ